MDEVWVISLSLTLLAFLIILWSLKSKSEPEPQSVSEPAVSAASSYANYGGKRLECSEEEMEKLMERLTKVLFEAEASKKEVLQEARKTGARERAEEGSQCSRDAENTSETRETVGKGPGHSQPAYQLSHHRVQERSAPAAGVENIMDEIEQAVQETVEVDAYASRRRGKQWSEVTEKPEANSM
ncbi:hypothetical protein FKM82_002674 [Ascaphus truei]